MSSKGRIRINIDFVPIPNERNIKADSNRLFLKLFKQSKKNKSGIKSKYPLTPTE